MHHHLLGLRVPHSVFRQGDLHLVAHLHFGIQQEDNRVTSHTLTHETGEDFGRLAKVQSISARPFFETTGHEELSWSCYQSGNQGQARKHIDPKQREREMATEQGNEITASERLNASEVKSKGGDVLVAAAQSYQLVYGQVDITMFEENVPYVVSFKVKLKEPTENKKVKVWYRILPWVGILDKIVDIDPSGEWTEVQTVAFTITSSMTCGLLEFAIWREPLLESIDLLISNIEFIKQEFE